MLMPDENGFYGCEHDDYKTDNIFAYMQHAGLEFDWMVRLSGKYSFNMFTFLAQIAWHMTREEYDEVWHSIQGVALLFTNSSGDDFNEFLKETEVVSGTDEMFHQLEQFLKEVDKGDI